MRFLLCILLLGAVVSLGLATSFSRANWTSTSGLLFDLAGVVQLGIAGFFDMIVKGDENEEKYPDGITSRVARDLIGDPDRPHIIWVRCTLFYVPQTGFWLIVFGFVLQLAGAWLPSM